MTTEMEMVERVARSLAKEYDDDPDEAVRPDNHPMWTEYISCARAAIEAMKHPTREMWVGWRSVNCTLGKDGMEEFTYFAGDYGNWLACHQAMIDAELKP